MAIGIQRTIEIVIRAKNKVGPVLAKLSKGISRFAKRAGKFLGGLSKRVKRLGLVFVGLAAAIATKAVKSFMSFDDVMRNVWTLIPIGEAAFRDLSDAVLQMSRELPKTPEDLGASLYDIMSAGITDTANALMVLKQSAKAAVAGVTDVATASAPAIAIMNAFGKTAADIPDIFDLLFSTVRVGVLRFGELQNAVGTMAASFASTKGPISEMLGSLAFLTKSGLNAARASTALNRAVGIMISRRKEFERILGVKVFDRGKWRGMVNIVGDLAVKLEGMTTEQKLARIQLLVPQDRARKAIVSMVNNYEQFARVVEEVEDRHGALNAAAAKQLDSLSSKWQFLKNGIQEVFIRLGEVLGVFLGPAFEKAQKKINGLADAIENNREKLLIFLRDLSTKAVVFVAQAFNFIAGVIDGATAAIVSFNLALKQMSLLFSRIERGKLGIPKLRELTPDEALLKATLEFVQQGIKDFGTLAAFTDNLSNRFDALTQAAGEFQEKGLEVPEKYVGEISNIQMILHFINREFGLLSQIKAPRINVEKLRNKLNSFFDEVEAREQEIRDKAEKPFKLAFDINEVLADMEAVEKLIKTFFDMGPLRRRVQSVFQDIGSFMGGVTRGMIEGGKVFANIIEKTGQSIVSFGGKFLQDFGVAISQELIPSVQLIMDALKSDDPKKLIKDWAAGAIEFVKKISKNIGPVIDALIDALPELFVAIADAIPNIMIAIAQRIPDLVILFVEILILHAPRIAFALAEGLVRAISIILLWVLDKVLGGFLRAIGLDPRKAIEDISAGAGSLTEQVFGDAQSLQEGGNVTRSGLFRLHEGETVVPGGAPVNVELHIHGFVPSGMDRRTIRGFARTLKEETETIIDERFKE